MDAEIQILLTAAALLLGLAAGAVGTHKIFAPIVGAIQELIDMVTKCRSAKADGTVTEYEERMIGRATIRFVDHLGATGSAILMWLLTRR